MASILIDEVKWLGLFNSYQQKQEKNNPKEKIKKSY
jgi:hypothetical protein